MSSGHLTVASGSGGRRPRIRSRLFDVVAGLGVFLALATSAFAQPVLVRADFLSLPGSSHATAINSSGQVTGRAHRPDTNESAFVWTLADGIVFIGLGGNDGFGTAINENGAVVGGSQTPSGDDHAFYWTEVTGAIDLGTLGGSSSFALDINDNEAVVGTSETATSPGARQLFFGRR